METMVSATLAFGNSQLRDEPSSGIDLASLLISLCDTATDAGCPTQYDGPDHAAPVCHPVAIRSPFGNLIDHARQFGTAVPVTLRPAAHALTIPIAADTPRIPPPPTHPPSPHLTRPQNT